MIYLHWQQTNPIVVSIVQPHTLEQALADETTFRTQVFQHLLQVRRQQTVFHPVARQAMDTGNPTVFVL